MTTIAPLSSSDVAALAALAARDDVARFGDHLPTDPPNAWGAWIGPPDTDRALTVAAWDGEAMTAAAKLTMPTRRRRHHAGLLELVACADEGDDALAALLDAVIDAADRWLHVDRIELTAPAEHPRVDGLFRDRGFVVESHYRASLRTGGALIDEVGLGRLRDGVAAAPPRPETLPLPVPFEGPRPTIRIRPIAPDDAPAIAAMMGDVTVVAGTLQTPLQRPDGWGPKLAANDPARVVALGAEIDGALAANAALMIEAKPRRRHVGSIGMMVDGAFQGRGVGRAILDALLAAADERGLTRVELGVYPDNERAVRLYRSRGFEVEGVRRAGAFRDGAYADDLAMARLREGR